MKILILACVLGYAAASLLKEAEPAVNDAVSHFQNGAKTAGSLSDALGIKDPIFADTDEDIITELGRTLKEALDELLKNINDHIDHGKEISKDLLEKVKDVRQKLKDLGVDAGKEANEYLDKIKEKAKELLKNILEKLGLGKRNLDHEMDAVARMKFADLVERIREKILSDENIQKIREYTKRLESNNPFIAEMKKLVSKLKDSEIKEILSHLLEYRPGRKLRSAGETWDKIREFFKELDIQIQEHSKKFGEWVKKIWGKGIEDLREKYGTIRAIALEFISHAKDMNIDVAQEALEFFRPYKEELGTLWQQIVEATKQAIGNF